jgi:hypothetical protein
MHVFKAFYSPYRMRLSHYLLANDPDTPIPKTKAEWEECKSTKMDTAAELVHYLLQDDNCPKDIYDENGHWKIPAYTPPPNAPQTDKVVIMQEFVSHADMLQAVSH